MSRQLSWVDCDPLFRRLSDAGVDLVVTGGQALNLWVHYLASSMGHDLPPVASKDIDVLGDAQLARQAAGVLGAEYRAVDSAREAVPLTAILTLRGEPGDVQIDFQADSMPNSAAVVVAAAVPLPTAWGHVRVMHPLHCVQSRIYNVLEVHLGAEKKYDNPHGLAQLDAALLIMEHFLTQLSETTTGPRKVLNNYEELFRFALSDLGLRIWHSKGVDVFRCVQPLPQLPPAFEETRYPQMQEQLGAARQK